MSGRRRETAVPEAESRSTGRGGADTAGRTEAWTRPLPGIAAVAATYVFFLLWAQYGFLDLLQARLAGAGEVRTAMAAMGLAGLAASLGLGWWLGRTGRPHAARRRRPSLLAVGFLGCAAVAPTALAAEGLGTLTTLAAAVGTATALVTVPLAAGLRRRLPGRRFGLAVGTGTGLAYLVCNLPPLFEGSPRTLVFFVAAVSLLAAVATWRRPWTLDGEPVATGFEGHLPPALGRRLQAAATPTPAPGDRGDRADRQADRGRDRAGGPAAAAAGGSSPDLVPAATTRGLGLVAVVVAFLALVWLDSAAFAVIQESAELKGATWGGASHSLLQGAVHLLAAVAAGWAVDRGHLLRLPPIAFVLFVVAFPVLQGGGAGVVLAGPLYALGISLYSVGLVAFPAAAGDGAGRVPARWRAALLYGVAGWLGSALGVGMAQDLHRIPGGFLVGAAGAMGVAAWLARGRRGERSSGATELSPRPRRGAKGALPTLLRLLAVPALFLVSGAVLPTRLPALPDAGGASRGGGAPDPSAPPSSATALPPLEVSSGPEAVARGRRVYVAEGCIHCHSQYVRPLPGDVDRWGPYRPLDRRQLPPLVGNRRQGPDLENVGNRRSAEWQRLHLRDPRSLVPGSRMPAYDHLFAAGDRRGEDLVAYLSSLGQETSFARWEAASAWPPTALPAGSADRGSRLFAQSCAACHGPGGRGDGSLAAELEATAPRPGLDLTAGGLATGRFRLLPPAASGPRAGDALDRELARLVRFGAPGTPMPGHEWLSVQEVADLVAFLHTLPTRAAGEER